MKIDPSGKQLPLTSNPPGRPVSSTGDDFSTVLNHTVQKNTGSEVDPKDAVRAPASPMLTMPIQPVSASNESTTVHGLLNALEKYQNLLGNSGADLKKVALAVDNMGSLAKTAQPVLDQMPEGHPVKTIAQETLIEISKEIERFNSGHYVDG